MNTYSSTADMQGSENIDVAPAIQPKRYNTRAASRRALGDISNHTKSSSVGQGPNKKRSIVPVLGKHIGDTARSISIQTSAEGYADPTFTKHDIVDSEMA